MTDDLDHIGHTVIHHVNGEAVVQHYGPEHIVDGSERIIDVPAGTRVFIRHILPRE